MAAASRDSRNAGLTEYGPFAKLAPPITNRNQGAAFSVDQLMQKQRRTSSSKQVAKKKPAARVQPRRKAASKGGLSCRAGARPKHLSSPGGE